MPPFAVSRSVAGNAWPTESMTCAIWSNGTRLLMPARASCAELKAAATPMALRFWQGTSTRPPTGSQTRPSRLLSAMELASSACSGVPPSICTSAAAAMLITQTLLNVLGSVDLLPLTGVTFPFVSMGGSSMLACWGLLAYLKAADTRRNASFTLRLPKRNTGTADEAAPEDGAADESQAEASPLPEQTAEHAPTFFDNIEGLNVDDIFGKEDHRS